MMNVRGVKFVTSGSEVEVTLAVAGGSGLAQHGLVPQRRLTISFARKAYAV